MRQLKWSIGFLVLMSFGCSDRGADSSAAVLPSPDVAENEAPLADLTTRTHEVSDWPFFLGPTRDSKSSETGIITTWPAAGPPIVWQKELGTGYGIGTISRGRSVK